MENSKDFRWEHLWVETMASRLETHSEYSMVALRDSSTAEHLVEDWASWLAEE